MTLLEQYEATLEKTAAEAQTIELLTKYASMADNLLAEEFGTDYTKDDVIELASKLIEHDTASVEKTASAESEIDAETQEKIAELYQMGQIIGMGIKAELNK